MTTRIAVLGMHRSGTSALTRLLGFSGCHLGDDGEFNPVRPDNPVGDWERTDVWALDEAALTASGATWCAAADFDVKRIEPARREELQAEAATIVARLDRHGTWAIKDPRLCLTLPLWKPALEPAACVIVHRHPLDVARSLVRRDGFPLAVGLALWELYVLSALEHSRDMPRVTLSHRRLIHEPVEALRDLQRDLENVGVRGLRAADADAVRGFVDPKLVHEGDDSAPHEVLTAAQARLSRGLEDGSALDDRPPAPSDMALGLIRSYFAFDARVSALEQRLRETDERFAHKAEEVERLAEARERAEEHARQREVIIRDREARIEELEGQATELETRIGELEAGLRESANRERDLENRIDELRPFVEEARRLQDLVDRLGARLSSSESDLDALLERSAELQRLLELVLGSRRWSVGNRIGELADRVLRREAQPPASHHARRILGELDAVREAIARRRRETGD